MTFLQCFHTHKILEDNCVLDCTTHSNVDTCCAIIFVSNQADGEDELKKRQLMELAIINGTYRDSSTKSAGGLIVKFIFSRCIFH